MIEQKVALVTGGTRGIGLAIATQLAQDGYALAVTDLVDEAEAAARLVNLKAIGPALYIRSNLAVEADRADAVEKVLAAFGRIDALVNNAGVAPKVRADLLETGEESFDFVLGINLKGTFFMTQRVANAMVKQVKALPGSAPVIVNVSSMSAYTVSVNRGEYCISKAGVSMTTQLFAARLAEYGIAVHEVRPGIIETDMTSGVKEKYDNLIGGGLLPVKRWGTPQDVANAVSALCSGKLGYSTGEVINVDGGFHIVRL